jgi:hypothetical protein
VQPNPLGTEPFYTPLPTGVDMGQADLMGHRAASTKGWHEIIKICVIK